MRVLRWSAGLCWGAYCSHCCGLSCGDLQVLDRLLDRCCHWAGAIVLTLLGPWHRALDTLKPLLNLGHYWLQVSPSRFSDHFGRTV